MDSEVLLTNGAGEAASLELAEPDIKVTKGPPEGEVGSAYPGTPGLFSSYDDGDVFEVRDISTRDFEEMLRMDGKAKTLRKVLTLPLRAAEYSIEPADGDSGEAEFVREVLETPANAGGMSTPFDVVIGQMTSAVIFRRAYFEKCWKVDFENGRHVYDKIAFRPATTCWLRRDRTNYAFKGFRQRFMRDGAYVAEDIDADKAFVYIHGTDEDPLFGVSDLETARVAFESKQKIRFLWYMFLENNAVARAVAKSASGRGEELAQKVAGLKNGGVLGLDNAEDSVETLDFPGDAGAIFKQAMDYLDAEMSGSVLAGFTDLPSAAGSGRGSYALADSSTDFFKMSLGAKLTEMGTSLTSWVLADPVRYNFGVGAAYPTLKFKPPQAEMVDKSIELLQALVTSTQPVPVPKEFIDLLTEKVAGYLGINADEIRKAIEKAQEEAPKTPVAQLGAGIAAAHQLVQEAGIANSATAAPAAA